MKGLKYFSGDTQKDREKLCGEGIVTTYGQLYGARSIWTGVDILKDPDRYEDLKHDMNLIIHALELFGPDSSTSRNWLIIDLMARQIRPRKSIEEHTCTVIRSIDTEATTDHFTAYWPEIIICYEKLLAYGEKDLDVLLI